jgi:hypothetical protein
MADDIEIVQINGVGLSDPRVVSNPAISPLSAGNFLQQTQVDALIREFLFRIRKDGHTYWVGAAALHGASDFTQAQVFFHPTVINGGVVHAADRDYPAFTGGWSRSLQRYVAMQGGLMASLSDTPLIVPFMTMAANAGGPAYMFATRPIETLNVIMSAFRKAITGDSAPVTLARMGVTSFSSGRGAMRLFIKTFGSSGLIVETTDLDGPFIRGTHGIVISSPGAAARVISQIAPPRPTAGWITLPAWSFKKIPAFQDSGAHGQIGWMTFQLVTAMSALKSRRGTG